MTRNLSIYDIILLFDYYYYNILISRFGEIQGISPLPDGSMTVQFKERRDAESAKTKGAFYNSSVLLLDWLDADAALSDV